MKPIVPLLLVLSFFSFLTACGSKKAALAPVSGTVTLGDKPVANAQIFMQPLEAPKDVVPVGAFGKTDAEGRYSLATTEQPSRKGTMPGRQRVTISFNWMIPEMPSKEEIEQFRVLPKLPSHWTDGSLEVEIPVEGSFDMNFQY